MRSVLERAEVGGVLEVGWVWREARALGGAWGGVGKEGVKGVCREWVGGGGGRGGGKGGGEGG